MTERRQTGSLRARGVFWSLGSLAIGILVTWIWMTSQTAWQAHLDRAFVSGLSLYQTLVHGVDAPPGVTVERMPGSGAGPEKDTVPVLSNPPSPAYVTTFSVFTDPGATLAGSRLHFYVLSPDLRYPVSDVSAESAVSPASRVGSFARLLASYCSEPMVFARLDQKLWYRVDGPGVWGCSAAPRDMRLVAIAVLIAGFALFFNRIADTASHFTRFARNLRRHGRLGLHEQIAEEGPVELRDVVRSVNEYLEIEREQLQKRAMLLSGVSHDLGTPATRLRLRSALIDDDELRTRLDADIDKMTGMIESVLTYTRAEMSAEAKVQLSLTSLVQAIVADYEDTGQPVHFQEGQVHEFRQSRSVFGGGSGVIRVGTEDARRVLVHARPISLQRAISNLIDNALKYGRHATVSVRSDSAFAHIIVDDEGTEMSEEMLESLTGPFARGENAGHIDGVGLGLTIVTTIARQHGGDLVFERRANGLRAILKISRQ